MSELSDIKQAVGDLAAATKAQQDIEAKAKDEQGKVDSLTQERLDKAEADAAEARAEIKAAQGEIVTLQTRLERQDVDGASDGQVVEAETKHSAIFKDLVTGKIGEEKAADLLRDAYSGIDRGTTLVPETKDARGLKNPEVKVVSVLDDTNAGALSAPPQFVQEINKNINLSSEIRPYARIWNISTDSLQVARRTGSMSATWGGESASTTDQSGNMTYALDQIFVKETNARVDLSNWADDDFAFNFESIIQEEASEQFSIAENTAFVAGALPTRPEGIITNSSISATTSANAGAIIGDDIKSIKGALKQGHRNGAIYGAAQATITAISKLKDSDGNYIWSADPRGAINGGSGEMLNGSTLVEMNDLESISTGNDAVIYGNLNKGYWIVDRIGLQVLRDPYTQASSGNIRWHIRKRTGGAVVLPEAIKKLTIQ